MTEKPLVFVSYASPDEELAKFIGNQIEAVLGKDRIDVFVSTIDAGEKWFPTIQGALDRCEALVVLVTQASIDRRWVWFEIGYTWARTRNAERHIYPLAVSRAQEFPHPLSEHQGKFLDSKEDIENFFRKLCDQFGFEIVENTSIDELIEMAHNSPEYPPQRNLSVEEIENELITYLRYEHDSKSLIRYEALDDRLKIPKGSSAKYLKELAKNNGYEAVEVSDSAVKIHAKRRSDVW